MTVLTSVLHAAKRRAVDTARRLEPAHLLACPAFLLAFAMALFVVWPADGGVTFAPYFGHLLPALFASTCLLLPLPHALATTAIFAGVFATLSLANTLKIDITQLPLTTMDFYVFWTGPEGVVDVLGIPGWSTRIVRPVIVAVLVAFPLLVLDGLVRVRLRQQSRTFPIFMALTLSALAPIFIHTYIHRVSTIVLRDNNAWQPERAADLSRRMGVLGFLAYSYYVASVDPGDYFSSQHPGAPPSDQDILSAAASYVTPIDDTDRLLPNIIVLFAESTFNPFYSFELTTTEPFQLFEPTSDTQGLGPLHVNTVGGGSWISEFESIVGVDARLFGYAGYYPHSALSPYIAKSLPRYLSDYGYTSSAYYAPHGSFFNARNAFLALLCHLRSGGLRRKLSSMPSKRRVWMT